MEISWGIVATTSLEGCMQSSNSPLALPWSFNMSLTDTTNLLGFEPLGSAG